MSDKEVKRILKEVREFVLDEKLIKALESSKRCPSRIPVKSCPPRRKPNEW